ncbi:hypothetical protein GGX14DRAFT_406911 [Mycena pura]|uniref:Uncharacterized protein n=1 Tax=Mycena pura TaxID=153505 RepID=A0AAD6UPS2_9AGAR|nr:hypothetical protein GGX14DRAFT_406911 [Mycena pura]
MPSHSQRDKENAARASSRSKAKQKLRQRSTTHVHHREEHRAPLQPHNSPSQAREDRHQDPVVRELRAEVAALKEANERLTNGTAASNSQSAPAADIPRPLNISEVPISMIKDHLGVDVPGSNYSKEDWMYFRRMIRAALAAGCLKVGQSWKMQDPVKVGRVYNLLQHDFPEMRRFEGLWGLERVVQECWGNGKAYSRSIKNPDSYRSRRRATRRVDRRASPRRSTTPSVHSGAEGHVSQPASPVAGPSNPRRPTRRLMRVDSAEDDLGLFSG